MVTLTFIVCHFAGMINDSVYQVRGCHPVQLTADEQVSLFNCWTLGQIQMARWVDDHPNPRGNIVVRYTCEPADRVKADL